MAPIPFVKEPPPVELKQLLDGLEKGNHTEEVLALVLAREKEKKKSGDFVPRGTAIFREGPGVYPPGYSYEAQRRAASGNLDVAGWRRSSGSSTSGI